MCQRWLAEDEDGGRLGQQAGRGCQYGGLLLRMYVGLVVPFREEAVTVIEGMMAEEGFTGAWEEHAWHGALVRRGRVQSSRFCQVVYRLGQLEAGRYGVARRALAEPH